MSWTVCRSELAPGSPSPCTCPLAAVVVCAGVALEQASQSLEVHV